MMERSVLAEPRHVSWASDLHSEYRSTYKWHEFKQQGESGVVRQPTPAPPASLPFTKGPMEPAMPRRKKYPGVAYKSNELFDPAPVDIRPTQPSERARRLQRDETDRAGRRSKSEGPRQTRWTDTVEPKPSTAVREGTAPKEEFGTEYRKQFAWPRDDSTPRKSISMGALKKAANNEGSAEAEPLMNHTDTVDGAIEKPSKKYIEDYLWNGQKPQVQRKAKQDEAAERMLGTENDGGRTDEVDQGKIGEVDGGKIGEAGALQAAGLQPLGRARGDSWYREVLDLRKRAGEYKYRGWGTELAPEHLTELYNKQIELWYQVSRRSSLSALSLAAHDHKALPRDEKDGRDSKGHSPKKFRSFRSAPQQGVHSKLQETRSSPHKTSPLKQRRKIQGQSFDETAHRDAGKPSEPRAEYKSPRRRPRSADPAPVQTKGLPNGHDAKPKPNGDDAPSHRSASVLKDHYLDDSPVVKSPPEPTRVKSPEQLNMRSPDPVNWTVPLDTGKTFTVTQNVKTDESIKRPGSEFRGATVVPEEGATLKQNGTVTA